MFMYIYIYVYVYYIYIHTFFSQPQGHKLPIVSGSWTSEQSCWRHLPMGRCGSWSFQEVLQPHVSKKKEHTAHSEGQYEVGTGCPGHPVCVTGWVAIKNGENHDKQINLKNSGGFHFIFSKANGKYQDVAQAIPPTGSSQWGATWSCRS